MKIKIEGVEYPATVKLIPMATDWDNRLAVKINPLMDIATAIDVFKDDIEWSVINTHIDPETEEEVEEEIDYSSYNVLGEIVLHNDRTITVKMGKTTELEQAYELLYGGIE